MSMSMDPPNVDPIWLTSVHPLRCKSKKDSEEIRSFELSRKEIFIKYDETRLKEEKNKRNRSKKKAHRGQSVRYRS